MRAARLVLCSLLLLASVVLPGCGPAAVGEACQSPGSGDDCVADAICTSDRGETSRDGTTWVSSTCRTLCTTSTECSEGFECRAVVGASLRSSCQPIPTE